MPLATTHSTSPQAVTLISSAAASLQKAGFGPEAAMLLEASDVEGLLPRLIGRVQDVNSSTRVALADLYALGVLYSGHWRLEPPGGPPDPGKVTLGQ